MSTGTAPAAAASVSSPVVDAQELLTRVIAGDEQAWNEVVDRYAGLVWSVARSYRLSSAATDDVVQTVWLRLAEHCGADPPARPAGIMVGDHDTQRSAAGHPQERPLHADGDDRRRRRADHPVRRGAGGRRRDAHGRAAAFAKLSPEDQQLMRLLCAVPPIDYQTIAEMLGRPIGSIGPTRARCLERLKKLLPPGFDPKVGLS